MSVTSEDTAIPASLPHTLCLFIECPLNQEGIPHPEGIYLESKERLFSEKEPFPSPVIAEALLFVEEAFHRACRALQALNAGEDVEMSEVIYMDSVSIVERYRFYHSSTHLPRSPIQKSRRISWPSSLSDTYPKARTLLQVTDEKLKTIYAIQEKVRREIREKVGIEVKGETMKDRLNRLEKEVAELTLSLEAMKKENESLTAQVQKSRMNYFNLLNARRHGLQIEGSKPQTKAVPGGIVAERIAAVEKKIQTTQKLKAKLEEAASTQLMLENEGSYTQAPVLPPRSLVLASEEKRPSTSGLERRVVTHGTQTAQQTSTDILLGKDSEQGLAKDSSSTGSRCKPNRRWSRKFVSWLPIAVLATVGRGL